MRWIKRSLFVAIVGFVMLYGGDFAVYKLRGSPSSSVTVNRYQTVPLKGNKIEYDFLGSADTPCSISIFPQEGKEPCWRLRRNPNQTINL